MTHPGRHAAPILGATARRLAWLAAALFMATLPGPDGARADDRPAVEFRRLLAFDLDFERGFRNRGDRRAREIEVEPMFRFMATIAPGRRWSGFIEADILSQVTWERTRARDTDNTARINQAYLRYDGGIGLRVGRWLYRDEREWLMDVNLDGVLLSFDLGEVEVDAFAGRVGGFPRELFNPDSRGDQVNYFGVLAEVEPVSGQHYAGYAILADDREDDDDHQISVGLRSYGELVPGLDYWANAGLALGRRDGRRLRGRGLDVGATYRHGAHPLQPRLTLGYAWGSGDRDPGGATDRSFRQTGLQSNEARLGGLSKFQYYGEALDPDLSNISIASAGVGITASARVSLDVFYHHYRRATVAAGGERHIGDGLDLILGYRPSDNWEIDAAIGWFRRGPGAPVSEDGVVARFEVEYAF